jgi:4-diphosphocytidyl-2-C-methyl-D-erythritol kinase
MGMPTRVRSHAKINLGLGLGAPRADGFHALVTVYQTLALYDVVTVSARPAAATRLNMTSNDSRVPTDERNTAWKIVSLALEQLRVTAEVQIHIEKRLPVQGGLGAGSANAVAALVGLEAELGLTLRGGAVPPFRPRTPEGRGTGFHALDWKAKRLKIAAQVGSDVPLFLIGGTVLGLDRGQEVYPLPDIEPLWCVVAVPEMGVSTPQAFRDWDALCATEGLTPEASTDKLNELSRSYASAFAEAIPRDGQKTGSSGVVSAGDDLAGPQESALVRTGIMSWIENDFERVVFPQHPSLREIKRILSGQGPPEAASPASFYASLSGSGSALYGLYPTRGDAEGASERLRSAKVQNYLTGILPRDAYWREMLS